MIVVSQDSVISAPWPFWHGFSGTSRSFHHRFKTISSGVQSKRNDKHQQKQKKKLKIDQNRRKEPLQTPPLSIPKAFPGHFFFFATPVVGSRGPSLAAEGRRFSSDRGAMAASAGGTGSASGGAPGVEKPGNLWVRWKEEKWTPMGNWAENLKRQNAASGPPSLETPCSVSFQEWHCRGVEKVIGSVSLATINNYHLKKRWTSPIWRKIATGKLGARAHKCWGMSIHPQLVPGLTASSAAGRLPLARISGITGADGATGAAGEGTDGWSFTFLDPFQLKALKTLEVFLRNFVEILVAVAFPQWCLVKGTNTELTG